jgi:hypothetical protein
MEKKADYERELYNWVVEQGDISLEALMLKAYKEFIRFEDFGRILYWYIQINEIE